MGRVYYENDVIPFMSYSAKLNNFPCDDVYNAVANYFGLTKGNFIVGYLGNGEIFVMSIYKEPLHFFTSTGGVQNRPSLYQDEGNVYSDKYTYRVESNLSLRRGASTVTMPTSGNYRYISGTSATAGFIYPKGYKDFFVDNVPIVQFEWTSLSGVNGIDRTIQLTKIKDEYINNAKPVTGADRTNIEFFSENSSFTRLFGALSVGEEQRLVTTYKEKNSIAPEVYPDDEKYLSVYRSEVGYFIKGVITEYEHPASFIVSINPSEGTSEPFLGILVDKEKEVATTTQIGYNRSTNTVSYNVFGTITSSDSDMNTLYRILETAFPDDEDEPTDEPISTDEKGNGEQNFVDEPVTDDELPPDFCTDAGFVTLFTPNNAELTQLARYMWTNDLFDLDNFKKLFADPMDCILGLIKLPVHIPTATSRELAVGNIGTGISIAVAQSQFIEEPMGTVHIDEERASFLDYSPYTRLEVYLPFCGTHTLNADEYVGKDVTLKYKIDIMTGACVAYLMDSDKVIDTFTGNMAYNIPFTSTNYSSAISSMLNLATNIPAGIGGAVATGGASLGATIANTAQNVSNLKPHIEKGGSFSGNIGATGLLQPYFLLTSPKVVNSESKASFVGIPSFVTKKLSNCSGFTQVKNIHLGSTRATAQEVDEIERLLKEGVIL